MTTRSFSIFLTLALAMGVFVALPARAQTAVPPTVNIDDPFGDANTTSGDQVGPADASSVGDIGKIWFSNTDTDISVHFQTEAAPPASQGLVFQVYSNPSEEFPAPQGCLRFITIVPGSAPNYAGEQHVRLVDRCNDEGTSIYNNGVEGQSVIEELGDGTGLITMTFPRSYSPLLADGGSIAEPHGRTDVPVGGPPPAGFVSARVDDTVLGTEYPLAGGSSVEEEEPKEEPPGKSDPPGKGKKKGCKKGKGKKCKKAGPKPPPAPSCPAYVPGEEGAEADTTIVTDAATEEKPVVVELTAAAGGPNLSPAPIDETSHVYQNVQVDTAAAEAGLWVRIEFTNGHDYDLYLRYPDGSTAANSGESQPVPGLGGGSEGGHEGGSNFEMITGMRTADCTGFTTDVVGFLTTGGPVTLSYWLGETKFDAAPPAAADGEALSTFYGLLGITR